MILAQTDTWFAGGPGPVIPPMEYDNIRDFAKKHEERGDYIHKYGFTLLDQNMIKDMLPHGPFIEVGAGTGALANRLAHYGADIFATDSHHNHYDFIVSDHYYVEKMNASKAVKNYPDRTVIMSWPTLESRWAFYALEVMSPGQKLIHIGEGRGGCTADNAFHNKLRKEFTEVDHGIHDNCDVYIKKGRKK